MRALILVAALATTAAPAASGSAAPAPTTGRGTEVVEVSGRSVAAARHRLSAPGLQIDLWYADGHWIALEAPTPGGRVLRYELQ